MSEFTAGEYKNDRPDPLVCEMLDGALEIGGAVYTESVEEVGRRVLRHNMQYEGFRGQDVMVYGNLTLSSEQEGMDTWGDGACFTYQGIHAGPVLDDDGIKHDVYHMLTYRLPGSSSEYVATAPLESIISFVSAASTVHLERLYRDMDDDDLSIPRLIDEAIAGDWNDIGELLTALARIDYSQLKQHNVMSFHAVMHHLNEMVMEAVPPMRMADSSQLEGDFSLAVKPKGDESDIIFMPDEFIFLSASNYDGSKVPILGISGTISSRSLQLFGHSVSTPVEALSIKEFIPVKR